MKHFKKTKTTWLYLILLFVPSCFAFAQVTVNSNFEGGNGVATFKVEENNEIHITSELKGGDTKNIVYYVEISGLNPDMPLILYVDATWRGHTLAYSFDQITWHRSNLTNLNNFNIPLTSSTIYVAHTYPYVYSDMINDVNAISNLDYVEVSDLTISEGGRPVKLVKITDACIDDNEKELIWIFGRMHAFEVPGNLAAVGMMNYFASDEPSAQRLRKEAIIYVVPMMDVDMAFAGGSGKDQEPVDFNRDWYYLNTPSHWNAVEAAKMMIDSTAQLNNFSVFFDSHSPPSSHWSTVFYYVYDVPQMKSNINFVSETVEQIAGYRGDDAIYSGLDISVSQDYVLSIYNNPRHYNVTMETGFKTRPDGVEWTRELYLLNGEYHGRAISDFIHGHAYEDDLIVDNNDPNVVIEGNWSSGTDIFGYLEDDYLYINSESPASIVFNATIDSTGTYEVFTRWVSHPDFATNASASFTYSEETLDFTLDMTNRGGNWISLDTVTLNAGEQVSLTINNTGANQTVIADGLRISRVIECASLTTDKFEKPLFNFGLYPNPATNEFTVQLENNAELEWVKVYDLTGRLVLKSNETTVNTMSLYRGLYIVQVKTNRGEGVKKLVIR